MRIDATLVESYDNPSSTQELQSAIDRLLVGKTTPESSTH